MATNYYLVLGIDAGASQHDVTKAYRRKAKEFHPDLYGEDSAPFKAVQEAYTVLGDPTRRRAYDDSLQVGPAKRSVGTQPEPLRRRRRGAEPLIPRTRSARLEDISLTRSFDTIRPSFDELFDRLWSNFTGVSRSKAEGVRSLTIEVPVPWEQADIGGQVRVLIPARMECPACSGRGVIGFFKCHHCGGARAVVGEFPVAVEFPPGIPDNYTVRLALDRLGLRNLYLVVRFRLT